MSLFFAGLSRFSFPLLANNENNLSPNLGIQGNDGLYTTRQTLHQRGVKSLVTRGKGLPFETSAESLCYQLAEEGDRLYEF